MGSLTGEVQVYIHAGGRGLAEEELGVMIEAASPFRGVVGVAVDVPDVGDVVCLEPCVNAPGDADEAVLVAAGKPEELELLARRGGVGDEFGGLPGIGRG